MNVFTLSLPLNKKLYEYGEYGRESLCHSDRGRVVAVGSGQGQGDLYPGVLSRETSSTELSQKHESYILGLKFFFYNVCSLLFRFRPI